MPKFISPMLLLIFFIVGCTPEKTQSTQFASLTDARHSFKTKLLPQKSDVQPVEQAPSSIFKTIKYPAASGELAAYVSPNPNTGKKHPAIIWITGGDCNSIGDSWFPASPKNDQTAAAFRKAGIVMMFPSLRGGNDNPGVKEGFLGEVDDVLAAVKYLEKQEYVDTTRIYLGGHSTGGTMALLIAELSDRFRAVFSFGPVDDVSGYGSDSSFLPFDTSNRQEVEMRSPGYWLSSVRSPVWVFEGTDKGNISSLRKMAQAPSNPQIHFIEIENRDHFATLAPMNKIIAEKILKDTSTVSNLTFSKDEVSRALMK